MCVEKARAENAKRSAANKYHGIALHYWGECYGRTKAQLDALEGKSQTHKCTGSQDYNGCRDEHEHCVGHEYAEYVYKFREFTASEASKKHSFFRTRIYFQLIVETNLILCFSGGNIVK